jgi:hypothetical protein
VATAVAEKGGGGGYVSEFAGVGEFTGVGRGDAGGDGADDSDDGGDAGEGGGNSDGVDSGGAGGDYVSEFAGASARARLPAARVLSFEACGPPVCDLCSEEICCVGLVSRVGVHF